MHTNRSIFAMQYLVGLYAYLFPKVAIRNRRALGPIHQFTGRAAFTAGLATMAVSRVQHSVPSSALQHAVICCDHYLVKALQLNSCNRSALLGGTFY